MIIFINAMSARSGGGQTYLVNLLNGFLSEKHNKIFIIAPKSLNIPKDKNNIIKIQVSEIIVNNPFLRLFWEVLLLPFVLIRIRPDVVFYPGGVISGYVPKRCKTVVTFQNILPFDKRQCQKYGFGYMRLRNRILKSKMSSSMKKADLVIFISRYAQHVIEDIYMIGTSKSVVIYHGIDPYFKSRPPALSSNLPYISKDKYILYVSTIDVYKSQIEVVQAYAILKKRKKISQKLILIGAEYLPYSRNVRLEIKKNHLENDVIMKGFIPYELLPSVYQNSYINIFASEAENCPFILLEAMASGKPLLVSRCEPMREFADDNVTYCTPSSPIDIADRLVDIIDNYSEKILLSEKALKYSEKYNWNASVDQTWNAIISLNSN